MSDAKDINAVDEHLEPLQPGEPSAEHTAWMNAQIVKRLEDKKAGKATYKPLAAVMRDFGF